MNTRSLSLLALLLLTYLAGSRPAFAQWAVFDGANLQENIAKYALAAQQRMTQLAQFETQVMREEMMYQNMMQNALALKNDLHQPLYLVANALTNPMLKNTAAGDIGGALVDGIELTNQTQMNLQTSRDAIGQALAEAESGGNSNTAQLHAGNQLAAVQAEIAMAQAQQQAARLDELQAAEQERQNYKDHAAAEARATQYLSVRSGQQSTDSGESFCTGQVSDKYCNQAPIPW